MIKIHGKSRILLALAIAGAILSLPQAVQAISGSDFRAGRIIDNEIFYNKSSMNVSQIQDFLNAKVPNCDNQGSQPYAGTTRRAYSEERGEVFPLTCLKDYHENTTTKENNLQGRSIPAGAKSAAQIIWDVAQQYSINPQVLIVLLQKEQALITDDWPCQIQYRSATGYGCPDSAPCDAEYYGFYNQVSNAARQFRRYATYPDEYSHSPGHDNNILWSPDLSCGSSSVFIENQATASLYNYTPYRPNDAALNNLYGIGNNCSSYGNRNFWRYFNDWFGSTTDSNALSDRPEAQNRIQTVNLSGTIYTFYYDSYQSVIRMAKSGPSGWTYSILDGSDQAGGGRINASLGHDIAVTTLGDSIQVFYYDQTNGNLRHAWTSDGSWNFETFDGYANTAGRINSNLGSGASVVAFNDGLQLFYYDRDGGNLRHAWTTPSQPWQFEDLDGTTGSISGDSSNTGGTTAVTLLGSSSIQLFYYDLGNGNLRHAWTSASHSWRFEDLDGSRGSVAGHSTDAGMGPTVATMGSSIQLFYYDRGYSNLRHAWTSASHGWRFEDLDGSRGSIGRLSGDVGQSPSVIASGTTIQLFYHDRSNTNLRHAWTSASHGWRFEDFDGSGGSIGGRSSDIGINSAVTTYGTGFQVFYYDRINGNLRHSWNSATEGWQFEDLGPRVIY